MAGSSRIRDILNHLAWLRESIRNGGDETDGRIVLKYAFSIYNPATLFEWYVTVSRPETPAFPYHDRDQGKAKKQANRFVIHVASRFDKIKKAQTASATKEPHPFPSYLADLGQALDGFLNSLPPAFSEDIFARRFPELELPVNPQELLAQRVSEIPTPAAGVGSADDGDHKAADPLMPLVQVLGTIFALEDLKKTGELLPEAHAGLRDVTAGYLADALGEAAKSTTRSVSRRLQRLEKQVTNSITPAAPEQN